MTSIQQSMNQMLGAVAGATTMGAYMYRQSDTFKAKQYDKEAKSAQDIMDSGQSEFYENDADFYEAQKQQAEELLKAREKAYKTKPDEKRHEAYIKATKEYSDRVQEQRDYMAEQNAISRLEKRSMTAREMLSALQERKDLLSAKERGQIGTMAGRHKDKGGMDK